jgi:hypothetical protein
MIPSMSYAWEILLDMADEFISRELKIKRPLLKPILCILAPI